MDELMPVDSDHDGSRLATMAEEGAELDIHKPKPVHGWREFINEIGVIVIGVLIALGAEQVVEILHWREQVAQAQESLHQEAQDHLFAAAEQIARSECRGRQYDRLAAIVDRPGLTPRVWPVGGGLRPWDEGAWTAATASGAVAHMPSGVRSAYASQYGLVEGMREMSRQAFALWIDLGTLSAPTHLSDVARDRLSSDIARLKGMNFMMTVAAQQLIDQDKQLGITLDASGQANLKDENAQFTCLMPDAPRPATGA